mgnify:CR=1 FL=1
MRRLRRLRFLALAVAAVAVAALSPAIGISMALLVAAGVGCAIGNISAVAQMHVIADS